MLKHLTFSLLRQWSRVQSQSSVSVCECLFRGETPLPASFKIWPTAPRSLEVGDREVPDRIGRIVIFVFFYTGEGMV